MSDLLVRYRWFIVALFALPLLIGGVFLLSERLSGPQPLELDLADVPAELPRRLPPAARVVERLDGDAAFRTDLNGDVAISTDGRRLWIETTR